MFLPDHFEIYELIPPQIYNDFHMESRKLWGMFDYRLLRTIHNLRLRYGKMIMNDWYWGGKWKERGWRPWNSLVSAMFSQHKFGRAADMIPVEVTVDQIRKDILDMPYHPDFKYITCIEMNVSWLHIDIRNYDKRQDGVLLIYPK